MAAHLGLKAVLVQEHWVDWPDSVYDKVGNILLSRLMGAEVRLDAAAIGKVTPLEIPDVDAQSSHHVRVSMRGFDVWESDVKFEPGAFKVRLQAVLVPTVGRVAITSVPPGAEAIVNGRIRGLTPATVGDLPPNEDVSIELRLRGYRVAKKQLSWGGKRAIEVTIPLEKAK